MPETIADVMTRTVRTASPDTSFKRLVRLVVSEMVGAIPVVDDDRRVVGIVSETDLLVKEGHAFPLHPQHDPFGLFHRNEKRRSVARTAAEVMTAPAIVVTPNKPVTEAAQMMLRHSIKHLPVVNEQERLVGIVSRGDLLRTFLRPDQDIQHDVLRRLAGRLPAGERLHVAVEEGIVTLAGELEWHNQVTEAIAIAEDVEGLVAVDSYLRYQQDERELALASTPWGYQ